MLGFYAAMSSIKNNPNEEIEYFHKETDEEKNIRLKNAEIERYKKQGLKEFFYGDVSIWALNKKSADKKFNKLKKCK